MLLSIVYVVLGLVFITLSADRFVDESVKVSKFYKISPLIIGSVIIGFGTSLPELFVSLVASLKGAGNISLGNVYGSNITNIALILGVTALIKPVIFSRSIVKRELPFLLFATALSWFLGRDGEFSTPDGLILLLVFSSFFIYTIFFDKTEEVKSTEEIVKIKNLALTISIIIGSLFVLILSSNLFIKGATQLAQNLGVSDLIIGLTIVAVGTSLPEFASSIAAARRGEGELVIGNILGSNIFNTLLVVGVSSVVKPLEVSEMILSRDLIVCGAVSALLLFMTLIPLKNNSLKKTKGSILFLSYVAYVIYLLQG